MPIQYPEGVRYIKIAKIDKDGIDQTNILQSLTEITIPFSTGNITYNVISITEKPTFFLYSIPYTNVEWADRAELEYDFTGSLISRPSDPSEGIPNGDYVDVVIEKDNLNFWERISRSGYISSLKNQYNIQTYPQKIINLHATGSISAVTDSISSTNDSHLIVLTGEENGSLVALDSQAWTPSSTLTQSFNLNFSTVSISSSISDTKFSILISKANADVRPIKGYNFHGDSNIFISSSVASGPNIETVPEPNFGSNDFSKDIDCQPLFNNADTNRRHNLFMDVDYSSGITEPTNFNLLISGSALRAEVQISNYTTRRHVIPRYEGSKSTSQKLNTWSKGDSGTYGKSPTVESLKRMVVYSDTTSGGIGGWPPDRMNASAVFIRYLIDEDGDVKIPNTSQNSLEDVQGTFQTGERVLISSGKPGGGEASAYRKIIKGGARIEPVLYTQIGKQPGALFTSSINLEDIQTTSGSATSNYQNNGSLLQKSNFQQRDRFSLSSGTTNSNLIGSATYSVTSNPYNFYQTPVGVVNEAVTLNIQITNLQAKFRQFGEDNGVPYTYGPLHEGTFGVILFIKTNGNDASYTVQQQFLPQNTFTGQIYDSVQGQTGQLLNLNDISFSIPPGVLQENSEISLEFNMDTTFYESLKVKIVGGSYSITQTPVPTLPILTGNNAIWGYFNKATNPSVITSSNAVSSSLSALYGDPNVKQKDIENSGFNTIALPWSIKQGDEFRFEGDERFTYMVSKVYSPNENKGDRLSQTGSIEVHFDKNLPISASVTNFNLDHFLIRRYIDDASQIIIEGFKPTNSNPPYIITPEFSVPKLNRSIDEYITILTEKNLLS